MSEQLARLRGFGSREACFWCERSYSYTELAALVDEWSGCLRDRGLGRGAIVGVLADYSPRSVGLLLALMELGAVLVPFSQATAPELDELAALAGVEHLFRFDADDDWTLERRASEAPPALIQHFRASGHAGLVVFTSGSIGRPKAILHDCERLLKKFSVPRQPYRTLLFLLFDHFGGFNTLMGVLAYGGSMVMPAGRSPEAVARLVEAGRVELLPVTPTLLNLLISSGAGRRYDLSSLKLITYGTERMPEATLKRIAELVPGARAQQTYGLSELGVLRSKSQGSDSLWVKLGGPGFETRVVNGILEVRSESAMLGYVNAEDPFDAEGWMSTGDRVEQRGEYFRILGREAEIINVGGQKVFPGEVEEVLLDAGNVEDATVLGQAHPLMGAVVLARVKLAKPEEPFALRTRLRRHCQARLAPYKVPLRFEIVAEDGYTARYKKVRTATPSTPGTE